MAGMAGGVGRAVLSVRRGAEVVYVHSHVLAERYLLGPPAGCGSPRDAGLPGLACAAESLLAEAAEMVQHLGGATLGAGLRACRQAGCRLPAGLERQARALDSAVALLRHPGAARAACAQVLEGVRMARLDAKPPSPLHEAKLQAKPGKLARDPLEVEEAVEGDYNGDDASDMLDGMAAENTYKVALLHDNDVKQVGKGAYKLDCDRAAPGVKQISACVNTMDCDTEHKQSRYDMNAHCLTENVEVDFNGEVALLHDSVQAGYKDVNLERGCDDTVAYAEAKNQDTHLEKGYCGGEGDTKHLERGGTAASAHGVVKDQSRGAGVASDAIQLIQMLLTVDIDEGGLTVALSTLSAVQLRGACTAKRLSTRGSRQDLAKRLARGALEGRPLAGGALITP